MKVIKAPHNFSNVMQQFTHTVFLAGSIEMGAAENWQERVSNALEKYNVLILNPRRDDWDSSWTQRKSDSQFNTQVNWELKGMEMADIIPMYFDGETKSPITLLELGLNAKSKKLFICASEKFWRFGNIEVVCDRYSIPLFTSEQLWLKAIQKEISQ